MPYLARTHPRLSAAATLGLAAGILAPVDSIISKILIGWNVGGLDVLDPDALARRPRQGA